MRCVAVAGIQCGLDEGPLEGARAWFLGLHPVSQELDGFSVGFHHGMVQIEGVLHPASS